MTPEQQQWLEEACAEIPGLFERIAAGEDVASVALGVRDMEGRMVQLSLTAAVVDPGANPLANHASSLPGFAKNRVTE